MQSNIMSDAERRETAERLFQRDQKREGIKEAIKLEEERRAASVKNLYRLRALRLERVAKQSTKNRSGTLLYRS
jgi:hypothetical protein